MTDSPSPVSSQHGRRRAASRPQTSVKAVVAVVAAVAVAGIALLMIF